MGVTDPLVSVGRINLWGIPVIATFLDEIDPFSCPDRFRDLSDSYDGSRLFWSKPSPEPRLPDEIIGLAKRLAADQVLAAAASALAASILAWEPDPHKIHMVAILRAGVPIASWLHRMLPGSTASALSLFVGVGIDRAALRLTEQLAGDRRILFIDGWTGKGGVAVEIRRLGRGPLAVLVDPWGLADFAGISEDLLCPSACFTGPATLGFSRTFIRCEREPFAAYLFPEDYLNVALIDSWREACPTLGMGVSTSRTRFSADCHLRIHANEVCRALINASPETLHFLDHECEAEKRFELLLRLADVRGVPVRFGQMYLARYGTRVACTMTRS